MAIAKENKVVHGDDLTMIGQLIKEKFVRKETGKGLSSNDFSAAYKAMLDTIDSSPTSGSARLVTSGGVKTALDGYLPLTGGIMDSSAQIVFGSTSWGLSLGFDQGDSLTEIRISSAHFRRDELLLEDTVDSRTGGLRVDDENMHGFYKSYDYTFPKATGTIALTSDINTAISGKQDTLVSGTNIKTINNQSLLGSGNITINADTSACELLANKVTTVTSSSTDTEYPSAKAVYDALEDKQDTINTVNVTVDNNTGTPSATASVSNDTLNIAFHNLKGATGPQGIQGIQGPQGNTGSSVDYPYELVNNLTTDDATKGLSAAQGVVLDGEVSQLRQEVRNIFQHTTEDGLYFVDEQLNVAMKYDNDGLDVAKVSDHFKSLLGGGGGGDFFQVAEDGLYFVDASMNIGAYIDEDGVHAPNIGESSGALEYDIIS